MKDGESAFPSPGVVFPAVPGGFPAHQQGAYEGMSLRDYFAAAVLQGIYSNKQLMEAAVGLPGSPAETIAKDAYAMADAMLAERAK